MTPSRRLQDRCSPAPRLSARRRGQPHPPLGRRRDARTQTCATWRRWRRHPVRKTPDRERRPRTPRLALCISSAPKYPGGPPGTGGGGSAPSTAGRSRSDAADQPPPQAPRSPVPYPRAKPVPRVGEAVPFKPTARTREPRVNLNAPVTEVNPNATSGAPRQAPISVPYVLPTHRRPSADTRTALGPRKTRPMTLSPSPPAHRTHPLPPYARPPG